MTDEPQAPTGVDSGRVAPPLAPLVVATVLVGLVGVGLAALLGGRAQVLGVVVGVALVVGFFVLGSTAVGVVATHAPRLSMLVALMTYVLQVLGLALVLVLLSRSGALDGTLDRRWIGGTVVVGTLGWVTALVLAALRVPARR